MFWRFRPGKNEKDEFGRIFEEAWKEHALWCLHVLSKNEPDDEEILQLVADGELDPSDVEDFRELDRTCFIYEKTSILHH